MWTRRPAVYIDTGKGSSDEGPAEGDDEPIGFFFFFAQQEKTKKKTIGIAS